MDKPPFHMGVNTAMEQYRHDTFWTKEPETIAWIESFGPDDVFFDIGANIGVYSLYAGWLREEKKTHPGLSIYAFEPVEVNYIQLVRNKKDNEFSTWFRTWRSAIGSWDGLCTLDIPDNECGKSGAQVMEGYAGRVSIWTIDNLVKSGAVQPPNHVKIDIDGQEAEVIDGMKQTLKNPTLKSVLIEVSKASKIPVSVNMILNGFTTANRFNGMVHHSRTRRKKEGIDAENIVFTRKMT